MYRIAADFIFSLSVTFYLSIMNNVASVFYEKLTMTSLVYNLGWISLAFESLEAVLGANNFSTGRDIPSAF